jgi:hypothetical protein
MCDKEATDELTFEGKAMTSVGIALKGVLSSARDA